MTGGDWEAWGFCEAMEHGTFCGWSVAATAQDTLNPEMAPLRLCAHHALEYRTKTAKGKARYIVTKERAE